jgi:hypothetical protein
MSAHFPPLIQAAMHLTIMMAVAVVDDNVVGHFSASRSSCSRGRTGCSQSLMRI